MRVVRSAGLAAVVGPAPHPVEDRVAALSWIQAHAGVVERFWKQYRDVIPIRAGTVFTGAGEGEALASVARWLEQESERLSRLLERVWDREEYGLEVWYSPAIMAAAMVDDSPELAAIHLQARAAAGGQAYLLRLRLQKALGEAMEAAAERTCRRVLPAVRAGAEQVLVDRLPPRVDGAETVMLKLSCLVARRAVDVFLDALRALPLHASMQVRLTGPWPPYSFVSG